MPGSSGGFSYDVTWGYNVAECLGGMGYMGPAQTEPLLASPLNAFTKIFIRFRIFMIFNLRC